MISISRFEKTVLICLNKLSSNLSNNLKLLYIGTTIATLDDKAFLLIVIF